jgi:hypothetical protein
MELAKLDPRIARKWKELTKDDLTAVLDENGIVSILRDVLAFDRPRTHKTTKGQADAIVKLLDSARFAPGAKEFLLELVEEAVKFGYFARGAGRKLDTPAKRADVTTALGHGYVGKIIFYSPGSKLSYTSILYEGVLDLIAQDRIKVFEVYAAGLNERCSRCGPAPEYRSSRWPSWDS